MIFFDVLCLLIRLIKGPSLGRLLRKSSLHSPHGWPHCPDRLRRQRWRRARPRTNIHVEPPTGGCSDCTTNWQPYVEQMLEIIGAEHLLRNTASAERHGYAPLHDNRPLTKSDSRGLKLGHVVWNLVFKRI